tara:strand:- start:364 stop:603 length:240 start_codon:yes stop_codon:yes gene_type:complete
MATLARLSGYRFFRFDNEVDKRAVVQAVKEGEESCYARLVLEPLMILDAGGLKREELRGLADTVREHKRTLIRGLHVQG